MPKYEDGEEISYTVTENTVPDYSTTIEGTTITNSYTPGKTSVTVTKAWNDQNNQDGKRPNSINVQLYANDKEVGAPVALNETNNWTTTWGELPEKEAGKTIVYTVKEVDGPKEYTATVNNDNHGNITITNTYTPKSTNGSTPHVSKGNYPSTGEKINQSKVLLGLIILGFISFIKIKFGYKNN